MVQSSQIFTELNIKDLQIGRARFRREPVDHKVSSRICSWDSYCKFSCGMCTRLVSTLQFSKSFLFWVRAKAI